MQMRKIFLVCFIALAGVLPVRAEDSTSPQIEMAPAGTPAFLEVPIGPDGKPQALSIEQTIRIVLSNNNAVRLQQLEILKSDTDLLKNESPYTPVVGFSYQGSERTDKLLPSTIFSGTVINQDVYTAYLNKLFSTGTYFQVLASDTRFDSNAGETVQTRNTLAASLAQPPLHTEALTLVLRQELLKNAFGYNLRRLNEIARNRSSILRQDLIYQLSQLVVKTMVDYWTLAITEENVKTTEILLQNTQNIRGITMAKRNIGLAEAFEVNQWNALAVQAENQLNAAILDRNSRRRDLLRVMNLSPELELSGATELFDTLPTDIDVAKDIANAYETRPDLKNLRLQMANARMAAEMAENNLLPSVTIGGRYSSRDYGRHANTGWNAVPRGLYPESGVEFKMEYPLWDEGLRVDARNANITLRQLSIQEEQLRRQIADEIRDGYDRIQVGHTALNKAKEAVTESEAYYGNLVFRYRQGRFTAVAVKNALDTLVQSKLALMQAKINYNISLVRYDLTRNKIFEKYNVDIDTVVDRLRN